MLETFEAGGRKLIDPRAIALACLYDPEDKVDFNETMVWFANAVGAGPLRPAYDKAGQELKVVDIEGEYYLDYEQVRQFFAGRSDTVGRAIHKQLLRLT